MATLAETRFPHFAVGQKVIVKNRWTRTGEFQIEEVIRQTPSGQFQISGAKFANMRFKPHSADEMEARPMATQFEAYKVEPCTKKRLTEAEKYYNQKLALQKEIEAEKKKEAAENEKRKKRVMKWLTDQGWSRDKINFNEVGPHQIIATTMIPVPPIDRFEFQRRETFDSICMIVTTRTIREGDEYYTNKDLGKVRASAAYVCGGGNGFTTCTTFTANGVYEAIEDAIHDCLRNFDPEMI